MFRGCGIEREARGAEPRSGVRQGRSTYQRRPWRGGDGGDDGRRRAWTQAGSQDDEGKGRRVRAGRVPLKAFSGLSFEPCFFVE